MNCEKNAVVCEGYHEKQIWKSGKERAEEGKSFMGGLPGAFKCDSNVALYQRAFGERAYP